MNSPQRHDTATDEQAAYWAARLEGDALEASERADLDAWLAQSPGHRAALAGYCQFSADLEEQLPKLVATGAVRMPAKTKPRRAWRMPAAALWALAATAALVVGLWVTRPAPETQTFASGVAERATHRLADGTRIELNSHTSVRFENTNSERRARLVSGEAIFFVTKDAVRPFIVETPVGTVRVTGTVFNVRAEPADRAFEVTVLEGSVEVRPREVAGGPIALQASDRLIVTGNAPDKRAVSEEELEAILAWREGQIVFNRAPLAAAVARFARHHGRSITLPATLAAEPIGGRHNIDDLQGFLSFIESTFDVKCTADTSGAITFR